MTIAELYKYYIKYLWENPDIIEKIQQRIKELEEQVNQSSPTVRGI
jgi:hypothetical protein